MKALIPLSVLCLLLAAAPVLAGQNKREEAVRNDLTQFKDSSYWTYDDLAKGLAEAGKTGKPLLIVFRCIP